MLEENFKTETDIVRYYVIEFLKDGKVKSKAEIEKYVEEQLGKPPREGVLSGCIYRLMNNNEEYTTVGRGQYQFLGDEAKKISVKVKKILDRTKNELESEIKGINLLEISVTDIEVIKIVKELISEIDNKSKNII